MPKKKAEPKATVLPKRGRPSKYQKIFCEELIDEFEKGGDISDFCARVNIGIQTFHDWKHRHEEFMDAYQIADAKALSFYTKEFRKQGFSKTNYPNSSQLFTYCRQRWPTKFGKTDPPAGATTTNNVTINSIDGKSYLQLKEELAKIPNLKDIIDA